MANTEIDSLSLEIEIKGLNDKDIANIDKLSKAVARLTKSLKDADFSKLKDIEVPKGLKSIQIVTQNFNEKINNITNGNGEATTDSIQETKEALLDFANGVEDVAVKVEDSALVINKGTEEIKTTSREGAKALRELLKQLEGDGKKKKPNFLEKLFKRFKTIAFIKAVRRILNAVVQAIQKGISNLALFDSEFNKTISSIKTSGTNIANSLSLTFRPLIETLEPFIANLSNALVNVSNTISKLQAQTKGLSTYTKINAKYTEDYAKSLQKANLFSFDTFNSIDTSNTMFEEASVDEEASDNANNVAEAMLELQNTLGLIVELVDVLLGSVGRILAILSPILKQLLYIINIVLKPIIDLVDVLLKDLLEPILEICVEILEPVLDVLIEVLEPIMDLLGDIIEALKPILNLAMELLNVTMKVGSSHLPGILFIVESLVPVLEWACDVVRVFLDRIESTLVVFQDIYEIFNAIVNFDMEGMGDRLVKLIQDIGKRFVTFISTPVTIMLKFIDMSINRIIDSINKIFENISGVTEFLGWGTWKIDFKSNLAGGLTDWINNNLSFANGGIVGELWQMNEYGVPEMLYNANNSGNTAVITQDQLARAFEQAIYNTGILDIIQSSGNLYLDGKEIAQSQRFKNELNRTNPSLNIR